MGYTLVKTESLEKVANAIRLKGGTTADLVFPDGFVAAIEALQSTPAAPTSETLGLSQCGGSNVSDGTNTFSNYVNVGHTSENTKTDAIWCFTPTINASSAVFRFNWDNTIGAVGYSTAGDYAFCVTENGADGHAAFYASDKMVVSIGGDYDNNGTLIKYGTVEVAFTGLALVTGTTYYIRANHNSDPNNSTKRTLKAFAKAGNTVQLTT